VGEAGEYHLLQFRRLCCNDVGDGYQLFTITPMQTYDPNQEIIYLKDFMVFFNTVDIVKFKPNDRET
tara:strand:+ start:759 stop:959 length:201 start_codon:yes stop_codon:yes gene_type:complete